MSEGQNPLGGDSSDLGSHGSHDISASESPVPQSRRRLTLGKKVLFATVPFAMLLICTEAGLRFFGYRSPTSDPYESFVLHRPVFEENRGVLHTNPARIGFFHEQSFTVIKRRRMRRVFVFGGSVTYGYGLSDPRREGYAAHLETMLDRKFHDSRAEVINCGGIAYASYRLRGMVDDCLAWEPDLVIVMSGHNEFLEARYYSNLKIAEFEHSSRLRIFELIDHAAARIDEDDRASLRRNNVEHVMQADEIDERYIVREADEIAATLEHYRYNLERMVDACSNAGVPIILCTCPSNVRDWKPFVMESSGRLSAVELQSSLAASVELLEQEKYEVAMAQCRRIVDDEPRASMFHYVNARCLDALGRHAEAKVAYLAAKDTDAFPHRALSSFNEAVRDISKTTPALLFDAEALFSERARNHIPGDDLFIDQCHPNRAGHALLAEGLAHLVTTQVSPSDSKRPVVDSTAR